MSNLVGMVTQGGVPSSTTNGGVHTAATLFSGRPASGPAAELLVPAPASHSNVLHLNNDCTESLMSECRMLKSSSLLRNACVHIHDHEDDLFVMTPFSSLWSFMGSFVESMRLIYLPFLWQSFFGGLTMMRYVLLGELTEQEKSGVEHPHSATFVSSSSSTVSFLLDPAVTSWMTCLALLAFVAMAVHPEGLTWMMVRRIRELCLSFLNSSSTCWAWLINDNTGVIFTILALATFCALFFFCYVLHRTLAPKKPKPQPTKKVRTTAFTEPPPSQEVSTVLPSEATSKPCSTPSSSRKRKKKKNSAKKKNSGSPPALAYPSLDNKQEGEILPLSSASPTAKEHAIPMTVPPFVPPCGSQTLAPSTAAVAAPTLAQPKTARARFGSASTVETDASSQWDEDSSVMSGSQSQKQLRNHHHRPKRNPNSARSGGRHSNNNNSNLVASSRWDALKPASTSTTPTHSEWKQCQKLKSPGSLSSTPHRPSSSTHFRPNHNPHLPYRSSEHVRKEEIYTQSFIPAVEPSRECLAALGNFELFSKSESCSTAMPELRPVTPLPPAQSPSDSFFSSELNTRSLPFVPSTPPKVLRAPPGLGSPEEQNQPTNNYKKNLNGSFFLPPASQPTFCLDSFFSPSVAASHAMAAPPGLAPPPAVSSSSAGATLPSGSCSPLCYRPSATSGGKMVPDNPFEEDEMEAQIEAMVGSVLTDF